MDRMFLSENLKIFAGSGNTPLTAAVCKYLGVPVGGAKIDTFPDGEKVIKLEDDVRGRDCFVIQSTCRPVDENLMELLIFLDCLRRASVRRVTAVIPYFGYDRQACRQSHHLRRRRPGPRHRPSRTAASGLLRHTRRPPDR